MLIWINLLLGHPKTKAFVTHGGANGLYEAIHHGIPMIGIPLFGEQHDNIAHMVAKGAAVTLNIRKLSRSDLLNALKEIIDNPLWVSHTLEVLFIYSFIYLVSYPFIALLPGGQMRKNYPKWKNKGRNREQLGQVSVYMLYPPLLNFFNSMCPWHFFAM